MTCSESHRMSCKIIHWIKFVAWLPWFVLTLPWQLRTAYSQVRQAITVSEDLDLTTIESSVIPFGRPRHQTHKHRKVPLKAG